MTPPDDFDPPIGIAETLEPGVRRIVAPNPSPMTYRGTNTYLLGTTEICVIDPGPDNADHLRAINGALTPGQKISHIVVTHAHLDHSPLARRLAEDCENDVKIHAFGPADAGMSPVMTQLRALGMAGGGEGIDTAFVPDLLLKDGNVLAHAGWSLRAIHTPGHIGNHLCLAWNDICFTADHVMGWASSLVSPPDGDLTDFMASCAKLQAEDWRVFYPGHGAPVFDPAARLDWLVQHRSGREAQILLALNQGPADAATLAAMIYTEVPAALLGAAARNVFAHLIDLSAKGRVSSKKPLQESAVFSLI
jgi:glyoxylase-like metal-dependent hydrolase (beta-lactamase superfamily II)